MQVPTSRRRQALLLALTICLGCSCSAPGDAFCTSGLHVPRLAMLFLARGGMPLERIWEPWFRSVVGLVPTSLVKQQLCESHDASALHSFECGLVNPNAPVLQQQLLYSVYVHSSRLNFTDFEPGSVFHGTLVAAQGRAAWGDTTPAVRILLEESLKDYMNHLFVLLSDSDIPLYPAKLTYTQLIQEELSRVDACHQYDFTNINRYTCAMTEDGIDLHHWRKSNLFMLLIRKHAEAFRDEQEIWQSFEDKCSGVLYDEEIQAFRGCLVDEHYYGSYLAVKNLAHETDCKGVITLANFTNSVRGHPKLYNNTDVHPNMLEELRKTISWMPPARCANATTYHAAEAAFLQLPLYGNSLDCPHLQHVPEMVPMDSWCQLFYRKFDVSAMPGLLKVMTKGNGSRAILRN